MNDKSIRKRQPPFSLWLSPEEKNEIKSRANIAGLSMGGYCKSVLFNTPPPKRSRVPSLDKIELSRLIGQVGALGNNVNQIARELHRTSAINLDGLDGAIKDIVEVRAAIMKALGYHETPSTLTSTDPNVREHFNDY